MCNCHNSCSCGALNGKVYFDPEFFSGAGTKNDPIRPRQTTVGPSPQIISFPALPAAQVGDAPITLIAVATSGLPVTFSSSNTDIASISGNVLTIHSAGTVTITASQAGNSQFQPADDVTRNLVITAVALLARWGWKTNNTLPSEADILAFQGSGTYPSNGTITANFAGAAGSPKYLFMAQPSAEPDKVRWYENDLNQEAIDANSVWRFLGVVGAFELYGTAFPTEYQSTVQFRNT